MPAPPEMQRYVLMCHRILMISQELNMTMQTEIQIDASGAYYEVGQGSTGSSGGTQKLQTAEISLNDCLACR
jgi:hypothetical protein